MRVYKASKLDLILLFFGVGFITLICIVLFTGVITAPDGQIIAKLVLIAWLCLLFYGWYRFLWKSPVEIRWLENNILEFRNIRSNIKISVEDITSIKAAKYPGQRFVTLRHRRGSMSLALVQGTQRFDEFLDRVSTTNPKVEIWVPKFRRNPQNNN